MAILIILIIAVVAFVMWSKFAAQSSRTKYLQAHNNALAQRFERRKSHPTWWDDRDAVMLSTVKQTVSPLLAKSGFSPAAVQLWLEADETMEDFLTFMAHAEKVGFKRAEQIALLTEFALSALNVDLFNAKTPQDKNVLLYILGGVKAANQQTFVNIDDLSPRVVADYLVQRGATVDEEVPEGHRFYEYEFEYRALRHSLSMQIGLDRAELIVFDKFSFTPLTAL